MGGGKGDRPGGGGGGCARVAEACPTSGVDVKGTTEVVTAWEE
jgi:hypothetical protein